jgi:hypothetical protein
MVLEDWQAALSVCAYRWRSEKDLQRAIHSQLGKGGWKVNLEHEFNDQTRFDVWWEGWVLEVKTRGALMKAIRQCARYAEWEGVKGVLLVTSCDWDFSHVPEQFHGKPFRFLRVSRNFL